jgi:hypothetical protein
MGNTVTAESYFLQRKGAAAAFVLLFFFLWNCLSGQSESYYYYYRVYFRDKGENRIGNYLPEDLLSQRAMDRRAKAGIGVLDLRDIPVFSVYLNQITSLGYRLHCTSKWMNTALFKTQASADLNELLNLPFVSDVKTVKKPAGKSSFEDKLDFPMNKADNPPYDRPVTMLNGYPLHNSGFDGRGILIAVLDGGFLNADLVSSLEILRNRRGIKRTYDFVRKNEFVYDYHIHGTAVLSVLAGKIDGIIQGTAPGADYILLRTEDVESEFPVEEDFWVSGAEYADSSGADIISSSLGYFYFDDPALNYKYSDLDGNITFISRAADIAASKGMLVVNSAGNERNKEWIRIIAPSDGDSVVAVGAVDGNNMISAFSSAGPAADGGIKPDNATMGVSVTVQTEAASVGRSSGTSFSCPVLSGMAACLMQAVPGVTNTEIIDALHYSSDRFLSPDSLYGYGVPDMIKALEKLQDLHVNIPDKEYVAGPNPTAGDIEITFREEPGYLVIEIISLSGETIFRQEYEEYAGRVIRLTTLNNREQGIYFVRLITGNGSRVLKVIKLNR